MWRLTFYKLHRNRKQGEFHLGSVWSEFSANNGNWSPFHLNIYAVNDLMEFLMQCHVICGSDFVKGLQNLLDENDLVVILAAPHRLAASMSSSICYTSRSQSTLSWVVVQECF